MLLSFFFFNDTATTEIYTLSLHDALPISHHHAGDRRPVPISRDRHHRPVVDVAGSRLVGRVAGVVALPPAAQADVAVDPAGRGERDPAAPVRYVLPHQVAALRHVDRPGQPE